MQDEAALHRQDREAEDYVLFDHRRGEFGVVVLRRRHQPADCRRDPVEVAYHASQISAEDLATACAECADELRGSRWVGLEKSLVGGIQHAAHGPVAVRKEAGCAFGPHGRLRHGGQFAQQSEQDNARTRAEQNCDEQYGVHQRPLTPENNRKMAKKQPKFDEISNIELRYFLATLSSVVLRESSCWIR